MKRASAKGKAGTTLVELLVALAAMGLASLLGLRLLHAQLEAIWRSGQANLSQTARLQARRSLESVWDARCADAFHPGDWLVAEGPDAGGWIRLERLSIRVFNEDGTIGSRVWAKNGSAWEWRSGEGNAVGQTISYSGWIRMQIPMNRYGSGEEPDIVWFELGGDQQGGNTDRFAIVGPGWMTQYPRP